MDRKSFLWSLDQALTGLVPNRERVEMIRYYEEYFDEAGPEGEASVIESLGDPRELARRLAAEAGFTGEQNAPKKRGKKPLIAVAIIAIIAVVLVALGSLAVEVMDKIVDVDFPFRESTVSTEWTDVADAEEFRSVDVEVPLADVDIVCGESYQVKLSWDEDSGYSLKYSVSGGSLKVTASHKSLGNLTVDGAAITIVIPEGAELEQVDIETGLGDIRLTGVAVRDAECSTGLGDIVLEARITGQASADTGLGDVSWASMPLTKDVELSTGMGSIFIGTDTVDNIDVQLSTGMGEITVNGRKKGDSYHQRGKQGELEASTGMGDIVLEYTD